MVVSRADIEDIVFNLLLNRIDLKPDTVNEPTPSEDDLNPLHYPGQPGIKSDRHWNQRWDKLEGWIKSGKDIECQGELVNLTPTYSFMAKPSYDLVLP